MDKIIVASVQFNHRPGDKAYNLQRIVSFVEHAVDKKVELIIFPEMCITGYWHVRNLSRQEIVSLSEPVPAGPSTEKLLALSAKYEITIGAGLIEISEDEKLYNTYVVAMPDGKTAFHRKLHCFISEHMESGNEFTVFEMPQGIKIGILICYDNNIIENVRITALKGAEILLAPHQTGGCHSPSPRCMGRIDPELWHNRKKNPEVIESEFRGPKGRDWLMHWLPARAHDNGMFLIYSNGVGIDDDEVRTGNAMIIDPYGDILAETCKAKDDIVIAELDMRVRDWCTGKRWITSRRPDLYRSLSEFTGIEKDTRKVRFSFNDKGNTTR
jgi:predicted amidohydrolase